MTIDQKSPMFLAGYNFGLTDLTTDAEAIFGEFENVYKSLEQSKTELKETLKKNREDDDLNDWLEGEREMLNRLEDIVKEQDVPKTRPNSNAAETLILVVSMIVALLGWWSLDNLLIVIVTSPSKLWLLMSLAIFMSPWLIFILMFYTLHNTLQKYYDRLGVILPVLYIFIVLGGLAVYAIEPPGTAYLVLWIFSFITSALGIAQYFAVRKGPSWHQVVERKLALIADIEEQREEYSRARIARQKQVYQALSDLNIRMSQVHTEFIEGFLHGRGLSKRRSA